MISALNIKLPFKCSKILFNSLGNEVLVEASGDNAALTLLLVGLVEPLPSESLEILRRRVAEQKYSNQHT